MITKRDFILRGSYFSEKHKSTKVPLTSNTDNIEAKFTRVASA